MIIILAIFLILVLYDLLGFIRKKEQVKVFIVYIFLMAVSLTISLLLAAGKRPAGPAQWIEKIFEMLGVVK